MLEVRLHGRSGREFDLLDGAGRVVGGLVGWSRTEHGRVRVGTVEWELSSHGFRRFELSGPQGPVATAQQVSFWSGAWLLSVGDRTFDLVRPLGWGSRYQFAVRCSGDR